MAAVRPYLLTHQNHCWAGTLRGFRQNFLGGFGRDTITVKIKDGCRRPHKSTDRDRFRADTTTLLVKHIRQVFKNSDVWSRRRCDNEIVTVLSKGQLAVLKMAAVRPHLLTDQNCVQMDISRHWEEFICKVSTTFLQWFRRRCDNGENQRWLPAAIFVDRPEPFTGGYN